MAARGRKPGCVLSETHRDKIKKSNILTALIEHAEGQREMSATQVAAGLGLLKFAFPPLQPIKPAEGDSDTTVVIRWKS